jgi:hypothetical protein
MNSVKSMSRSISADKTSIDKEMNDDSGIIPSTAQPAPATEKQTQSSSSSIQIQTTEDDSGVISPPAVQPATPVAGAAAVAQDPLGEAKNRVQEEIKMEFAAIMAIGATQASEAAALAMRRVMERHGRRSTTTVQRG